MSDVVIGREQCPKCAERGGDSSGDNLARYADGHGHCFNCGYHERGEGEEKTSQAPAKRSKKLITDLEYRPLIKRKIDEETCRFFGYAVGEYRGKNVQVATFPEFALLK